VKLPCFPIGPLSGAKWWQCLSGNTSQNNLLATYLIGFTYKNNAADGKNGYPKLVFQH
jgi:hypothetical protein